jgi:flagellar biosynthetic protein FliO
MNYPPEMWTTALKMIAALAIVIGFLFISLHLFKRMYKNKLAGQGGNLINVLASSYVGVKKNVALVEVPGTVLVLGITNDRISLLSEISKDAVDAESRRISGTKKPTVFAEHLRRLTTSSKGDLGA